MQLAEAMDRTPALGPAVHHGPVAVSAGVRNGSRSGLAGERPVWRSRPRFMKATAPGGSEGRGEHRKGLGIGGGAHHDEGVGGRILQRETLVSYCTRKMEGKGTGELPVGAASPGGLHRRWLLGTATKRWGWCGGRTMKGRGREGLGLGFIALGKAMGVCGCATTALVGG